MSIANEKILNLKEGETCYPFDRADISVTLSCGSHPYCLLDNHGFEYFFDTAENCSLWIQGDRAKVIEGIHVVWEEDERQVYTLPCDENESEVTQ